MDTDGKLDMLLKLVEENERKHVEADERTRAEYQDLKRTVELRIPVVERKVEELGVAFQELNTKVDRLEVQFQRPIKEEQPAAISEPHATTPPEGLRDDIRMVVMIQRPQDLDTACAIALLQEEALEGMRSNNYKKSDSGVTIRSGRTNSALTVTTNARSTINHYEDRRGTEAARARDD